MKKFRIISQWRLVWDGNKNWGFVPFSIWSTDDFFGLVLFNYCFEWSRVNGRERMTEEAHGDTNNGL